MKSKWIFRSLGECFPSIKNGANIKQVAGAKGYPITRIETLSGGVFNRNRMGYANVSDLTKYQDYILESGDILMSHINSKAYIGRTVEYQKLDDEVVIHGMNLLRLRNDSDVINPSFFVYYTKSSRFKDAVARIRKDAVNQSSMAITDLRKIQVPCPSLLEQSNILAELDLLTGVINKRRMQLKELDTLAYSIFYDMFGNPVENEKGWKVKRLGECCKVGTGATPNREKKEYYGGDIPWVKTTEVSNCLIDKTEECITQLGLDNSNCTLYPVDTILIAMYGQGKTRGQVAILGIEAATNQACAAIQNDKTIVDNIFLYQHLLHLYDEIRSMARGGNQANLNLNLVRSIKIILPPLTLQQEFADKIQSIEKQKAAVNQSIAETQKLLDYTMDKYFG